MHWNAELEEALRGDPYDEGLWSVLEDWTLAQGDDRARTIELDKADDHDGVETARRRLEPALFGTAYQRLQRLVHGVWRAGYLTQLYVQVPAGQRYAFLAEVLALRCARVVRSIYIDIDQPAELALLTRALAGTAVRELQINAFWKPPNQPATFDPAWLAPLSIEVLELAMRAIALPYGEPLAKLRELWLTPGGPEDLRTLFCHTWPRLEEVGVHVGTLVHRHGSALGPFDELLAGETTPALRRLHLYDAPPELQRALIEQLATSSLLPRLEKLAFSYRGFDLASVPRAHRDRFARFAE